MIYILLLLLLQACGLHNHASNDLGTFAEDKFGCFRSFANEDIANNHSIPAYGSVIKIKKH